MSSETSISAMRRKIGAKRAAPEMSVMSPTNALRRATVRAAQNSGGLVALVTSVTEERVTIAGIIENLPDPAMVLLLNGPEAAKGLVVVDTQFMAGVIEHTTTGRVVPAAADARRPTQTDAIIVAALLDRILAGFDRKLAAVSGAPPVSGFRYSAILEGPRAITLAMEQLPYRSYQLTIDLGGGAKTGTVSLVFPWYRASVELLNRQNAKNWRATLHSAVSGTGVSLEAVLYSFSMSLHDVVDWDVGAVVPVPVSALANVVLKGDNGRRVASGKLGQCAGSRAVRIRTETPSDTPRRPEPGFANLAAGVLTDTTKTAPQSGDSVAETPAPDASVADIETSAV